MMLKTLMHLAGEDTTVILMSDHGFHPDHLRPRSIPNEPAGAAVEHRNLGIFVAKGPGIKQDSVIYGASVIDICPTILSIFGLPCGEDMDGRPLIQIFEHLEDFSPASIPSWEIVQGRDGQHPADKQIDPVDAQEAIDRLVALGYIEKPSEDRAIAIDNTLRELRYNLACSYIDGNRYDAAEAVLSELHERWPNEHRFGLQLANCLRARGDFRGLCSLVNEIIGRRESEADNARAALEAIKLKRASESDGGGSAAERTPEEERQHRELIRLANPNLFALQQLRSWADVGEKRYEDALDRLAKTGDQYRQQPEVPLMRGQVYLAKRQWKKAQEAFADGLAADNENAAAHLGLCRAYLGRREHLKAVEAALAAVGLHYYQPQAHFLLGVACLRLGDARAAVEAFEVAVQQHPNYVEAHARLAFLYKCRLNDPERGEHYRAQALLARQYWKDYRAGKGDHCR